MAFVKATRSGGALNPIPDCYLDIPMGGKKNRIEFKVLPDISDQKTANYSAELVMGRSSPMKNYIASDERTIGVVFHFVITEEGDALKNMKSLRLLQGMVYPRDSSQDVPFLPPPVCQLRCGRLLGDQPLCVVMKSYSVKMPTDVAWDETHFCPVKFDVDTNWDVVYASSALPGSDRIVQFGEL